MTHKILPKIQKCSFNGTHATGKMITIIARICAKLYGIGIRSMRSSKSRAKAGKQYIQRNRKAEDTRAEMITEW